MLERLWRKGNPCALFVGIQSDAATVENSMGYPQKLKTALLFDQAIPFLGIYPNDPETPTLYICIYSNIGVYIYCYNSKDLKTG